MPKTARQLDREIKEVLERSSRPATVHARRKAYDSAVPIFTQDRPLEQERFQINGVKNGTVKNVYAKTRAAAKTAAKNLGRLGFLVTAVEQHPKTRKYRAVFVTNREDDGTITFSEIERPWV